MATTAAETAVRNYLTFLSDPDSLVDRDMIRKLQTDVDRAEDPIDKLRAISQLETARKADPETYRQAFIDNAKEWAEAEGVPPSAFEQLGVPQDVLRDAGLSARGAGAYGRESQDEGTSHAAALRQG